LCQQQLKISPLSGVRGKYGNDVVQNKSNRTVFLRANLQCGFYNYLIERQTFHKHKNCLYLM
ncbi:MAG: hypothetical protein RR313_12400, partial [Anaerovoracaceae bacterium]